MPIHAFIAIHRLLPEGIEVFALDTTSPSREMCVSACDRKESNAFLPIVRIAKVRIEEIGE
jgi:hypothetical protein